jgi:hypothetical protein
VNALRFGAEHAETRRAQAEAAEEERQVGALLAGIDGASFTLEQLAYVAVTA